MSALPDEMWRTVMDIGIETKSLQYRDLCSLSISCRRLRRLASEDSLWSFLLLTDFSLSADDLKRENGSISSSIQSGKFKSLYKIRYEKDREKNRLARRRVVLRMESEVAERLRKIRDLELQSSEEKEKLNMVVAELRNLRKARQASVAMNVWQPEVIRGKQKEMIQQSNVPVEFRINALEMEISLCKQQIAGFDKALRLEKRRLHEAEEQLASVKYHPLEYFRNASFQTMERIVRSKKFQHTSNIKED
ncbi:F-box protein SKIP24 isoform X1 [Andrographis paniculata]|uniref:F-box protein SKIP24 isoform X1 n=1 Tax=Andrographis paniculata TaxID=175694 RepID=UPI0021E77732|nr:F-box protein SKIP24 isoform X1 [Andrographis paniculata]